MTSYSNLKRQNGTIPYRLRLSDASDYSKTAKSTVNNGRASSISMEERWANFLWEFFNERDDNNNFADCPQKILHRNSCENLHDFDARTMDGCKPVWVDALNMWLSPAKAKIFEKHWGQLSLDERIFSSDPAPYIPRCTHFRCSSATLEMRNLLMRKAALDSQLRLKELRDWNKTQELKKVKKENARFADIKRTIRANHGLTAKRDKDEDDLKRNNHLKSQADLLGKTKKLKKNTRAVVIPGSLKEDTKESKSSGPEEDGTALGSKEANPVSGDQLNSILTNAATSDDTGIINDLNLLDGLERANSLSDGSQTPELEPVVLPEWVQTYLNEKRKLQENTEQQLAQNGLSSPPLADSSEDDKLQGPVLPIIAAPDNDGRSTASLMEQTCQYPIGIENGKIIDSQITASSEQGPYHRAYQARLNNIAKGKNAGAWCPKKHDQSQWLQIDMGRKMDVLGIATQGMPASSVRRNKDKRWVEVFTISYSSDDEVWNYHKDENGESKIFIGNLDLEGTSKNLIVDELQARYLRIHPLSWHNGIALRVEIFAVEIEDEVEVGERPESEDVSQSTSENGGYDNTDSDDDTDSASEYIVIEDEEDTFIAAVIEEPVEISCEEAQEEVVEDISIEYEAESATTLQQAEINESSFVEESNLESHDECQSENTFDVGDEILRLENKEAIDILELQRSMDELNDNQPVHPRITFRSAVKKLMIYPDSSTGLMLDGENEDKDEFLSKYCILKESQKILYSRIFQKFDKDCDGLIAKDEVMLALKGLNITTLKESEMDYIMRIIDVFEEQCGDQMDQKAFNVLAAFSDRLKQADTVTRDIIRGTNFATLYLHAHKTRDMFERMLERGETTISSEQFLIELEAGGVKPDGQDLVRNYVNGKKYLDFLDFAIYFPLFLFTHEQIMSTPL